MEPSPRWYDRDAAAVAAVLAAAALLVGVLAATLDTFPLDVRVAASVRGWGDGFAPLADLLNERNQGLAAIALVAGLALAAARRRPDAAAIFGLALLLGQLLRLGKGLIDRPRPTGEFEALASFGGSSFPSGHVLTAATVYGAWFVLAPALLPPRRLVLPVRVALCALIALHALARVWAGVHWPSDTYGAVLWSSAMLAVLLALRPALARLLRAGGESGEGGPD